MPQADPRDRTPARDPQQAPVRIATAVRARSPGTTLTSSLPRLVRVVDGYHQFEVSAQQYELAGQRVHEVLVRQHLWDQGVRFGANFDPDKNFYFVLIDPGLSGLSARDILDRLLGII